jgi:predicted nucleic-acid-binding Zn-ribbon protein
MSNTKNNSVSGETVVAATPANEMKKLVKSFNEMMKEQVKGSFEATIHSLEDIVAEEGEENQATYYFSSVLDFGYDYDVEWCKFAMEKVKVASSVAFDFYLENKKEFINEDAMREYVETLFDEFSEYYDIDKNCLNSIDCKVCMYNPYYDEDAEMTQDYSEEMEV